mgnify:CR=1 FL=1
MTKEKNQPLEEEVLKNEEVMEEKCKDMDIMDILGCMCD